MFINPVSTFKNTGFSPINCTKPKHLSSPSFGMAYVDNKFLNYPDLGEYLKPRGVYGQIKIMGSLAKEIKGILDDPKIPDKLKATMLLAVDTNKNTALHLAKSLEETKALLEGAPDDNTRVKMLLARNAGKTLSAETKGEKDTQRYMVEMALNLATKTPDISKEESIKLLETYEDYTRHQIFGMQDLNQAFENGITALNFEVAQEKNRK